MPNQFSGGPSRQPIVLSLGQILAPGGTGNIRDINPSFWFSPLQPVQPSAPASYRPRQRAYQPGENIIWQPKGDSPIGYDTLRELADSWDILRIGIETVKDQITKEKWEIRAKPKQEESKKDYTARNASDKNVIALNNFFQKPDGIHNWPDWLRLILEDMLVIDAVALYLERDKSGKIASIHPLDGATINRLITEQGWTPPSPSPAYQQVVYGTVACDFTTDDLLFYMRNERTHKRYGYSPVEQLLITINIGLRKMESQLYYYTDGNTPEAMVFMPNVINIDKIKEYQDYFDSVLVGDLAQRSRVKFLPGVDDKATPNVVFPKEAVIKDELDVWLAQKVCNCLGISAMPFMKMINRASGQEMNDSQAEEGKEPKKQSVKTIMDQIIQEKLGFRDYEFEFKEHRETDVLKQAQADKLLLGPVYTSNEIREARGEDKRSEPEADMLGMFTAAGFVPIGGLPDEQQETETDGVVGSKPEKDKEGNKSNKIKKLRRDYWSRLRFSETTLDDGINSI